MENIDEITPKSFIEQIFFSMLRIELLDNNDKLQGIGSGFIVRANFPKDPNEALVLLVSNKHVLAGSRRFNIDFHQRKTNFNLPNFKKTLRYHTTNYEEVLFLHPDPKIDLACINISNVISQLGSSVYFKNFDKTVFANFNEPELELGQRIVFVGYPENRYDRKHNLPILRSGVIASHPKLDYNGEEQFLIDAQVFPGSSGSPVFLNMKEAQYNRGQIILGKGLPYLFVGVVSATMIKNNIVSPLPTTLLGTSQEVIGLGIVYKATALNSLIDLTLKQTWDKIHSK